MEADWTQESKDAGAVESHGKYISAIYRHMQILIAAELAPFRIGERAVYFSDGYRGSRADHAEGAERGAAH